MIDRDLRRAVVSVGAQVTTVGPVTVLTPSGRETARRTVEVLAAHRARWAPLGGGRRPSPEPGIRLSTRSLSGVIDLWAEDLVCRVGAGTPLGALDSALLDHGLRLSALAPRMSRATVAGAFASADRGLSSAVAGGLRDRVLGATFVDGAGNVVKAGARVVKNVAGYDLARLHHGARGALGLILDLVVRLDARPQAGRSAGWPCPLTALPERLASVRRPATEVDPHVQVWVNASAAKASGLGREPHLVAAVEGWEQTLEQWSARCGAGTAADLASLRDLPWTDEDRWVVRWAAPPSVWIEQWPGLESALDGAGADPWAIGDCLAGEMHIAIRPGPKAVSVVRRIARPHGPVVLDWAAHPVEVPVDVPAVARRLKSAFDPHDLLPALPAPWRIPS